MPRTISLATFATLLAILFWSPSSVNCQAVEVINSFEENWKLWTENNAKRSQSSAFSPPISQNSTFSWAPSKFGSCFGCGRKSYKAVTHDCVHKLPMQLTMGNNYSRSLMGVFKVPDTECVKPGVRSPVPVNVLGCGPPCSELRLLRGKNTGCRCDTEKKLAYDVPKLMCQDNRNRTVSLALCKFMYDSNVHEYHVVGCDYAVVCTNRIGWIAGNWTACSHDNSITQRRDVVCATQSPTSVNVYFVMHDSMCIKDIRPSKMQFCARWTAERFFTCNCYTGNAVRRILCMRILFGRKKRPVDERECGWHDRPTVMQPCNEWQLKNCRRSGRRLVK